MTSTFTRENSLEAQMSKRLRSAFVIVCVFAAIGCAETSAPSTAIPSIGVLRLTPKTPKIKVGESVQLEVELTNLDLSKGLIWFSEDENTATVSSAGLVTGIKPGKVYITVRRPVDTSTMAVNMITVE